MKVKMKKTRVVQGHGRLEAGETYDLPNEKARALVDLGIASGTRKAAAEPTEAKPEEKED